MADGYIEAPVEVIVEIVGSGPQGKTGPQGPQGPPGDMDSSVYDPNGKKKDVFAHEAKTDNPHSVTLAQVGGSNPNLLDNWYFANPINQRGLTEYSGAVYGIDRWKSILSQSKYALGENGIIISSGNFRHLQLLENAEALVGRELTVSILVSENTATTNIGVAEYVNGTQGTTKVAVTNKKTGCFRGTFTASEGFEGIIIFNTSGFDGTAVITAVKLELGSQQTLAHQDESGNWILNEIPDYGEQLAKCQRYQMVLKDTTYMAPFGIGCNASETSARVFVPTPVEMRANPSINVAVSNVKFLYEGGAVVTPTAVNATGKKTPNGVYIPFTVSGVTVNDIFVARAIGNTFDLILDANL